MIYINARFLTQKKTGVQQFAINLCRALNKLRDDIIYVMPNVVIDQSLGDEFNPMKIGKYSGHFWEQFELPIFLKGQGSPLLVCLSGLAPIFYANSIFTIHDMSLYHNPKWFKRSYRFIYKSNYLLTSKRAKKIITVSEFSKKEIIKYLKCDEGFISVIYNSIDSGAIYSPPLDEQHKFIGEYFLTVGSIEPRKNLDFLIKTFLDLDLPDCKLIIVGGKGNAFSDVNINIDSEKVIFTGYISEEKLFNLYRNAKYFIYPSVYEGFGLPPLEAMGFGCPVLVSNMASMPEVCADSALYFDPFDEVSLRNLLSRAYKTSDGDLRAELICHGYERIKAFNVENEVRKFNSLIDGVS
ncbi:glycosyltransferase involved in cell wall biosynthesis [Buttiauxella sp. JUb87]|uniref:glycosyltransferase family 4 protein n=1 Tax=Buttiauxella sp. JUb87 TaxID=2485129 RepID=UPI00105F7C8D|nr:glycosyltransferase family 1 protein [Buttiauxella sp. JUb87]TDN55095.1 glycosyltransferase involved in cell wall biosynthesis [Buttiauxella sp. JUb87]